VNPYATVKQAYARSSVLTASPGQLVVMLYDGAIRFLRQSAEHMRAGNREQARERMRRAEAVIDELNWSLDLGYGEVAQRLRAIYLFSKRQLIRANLDSDPAPIEGVARMLSELREAFAQAAERADSDAA